MIKNLCRSTVILTFIFFITKLLYLSLRFKISSNQLFMICLVIVHLISATALYPIYPLLHFQMWKF
jgi:hypothetical protein